MKRIKLAICIVILIMALVQTVHADSWSNAVIKYKVDGIVTTQLTDQIYPTTVVKIPAIGAMAPGHMTIEIDPRLYGWPDPFTVRLKHTWKDQQNDPNAAVPGSVTVIVQDTKINRGQKVSISFPRYNVWPAAAPLKGHEYEGELIVEFIWPNNVPNPSQKFTLHPLLRLTDTKPMPPTYGGICIGCHPNNFVRGSSFDIIGITILSSCLIIISLSRLRIRRK